MPKNYKALKKESVILRHKNLFFNLTSNSYVPRLEK